MSIIEKSITILEYILKVVFLKKKSPPEHIMLPISAQYHLGIMILELTRLSSKATDLSGDELAAPCLSVGKLAGLAFCI